MAKLLFIRYKKSRDILEGGEKGSQKNHDILSCILGQENVDTYYIHDENRKRSILDYVKGAYWFFKNYYFGLTGSRIKDILVKARHYDYIFIDRSVFGIIAKKLKETGYTGKIITFFHNVEVEYFKAKIPTGTLYRPLLLRCVDRNDAYSCHYSDKIIALNTRDDDEIERRYGRRADVLIPVAMKDCYLREQYPEEMTRRKPLCFFLGAYFTANNEGIKWFIEQVYPFVNISLIIVGKGMSKFAEEYKIPEDVEVINNAPDLTSYFENADIMILPIFSGSGMKVKTCESLMYGKHILGTSEAFEGYEVDFEKVGGLCNTKEEFINKIKEFEASPRRRFNNYSRQQFLEKYSEDAVIGLFSKVLE